jgi:hypothetical protein
MGELNSVAALWAARQELPKAGNGHKVALWRVISGMEVGKEDELAPGERAAGLRKLVNVFARVLKNEFLEQRAKEKERRDAIVARGAEVDRSDGGRDAPTTGGDGAVLELGQAGTPAVLVASADGRAANETETRDVQADSLNNMDELPRSGLWDPVATVCSYLSIAERMLSRVGREVCGYSAQQMADRLRVRELRGKFRVEMEAFVLRAMEDNVYERNKRTGKLDVQWYFYKLWLAHKRELMTESNDARAVRFGFKYYGRYKQACLMEFGLTPDELEFEALDDAATYFSAIETLERRADAVERGVQSSFRKLAEKPYRDAWAKLYRARPEWLIAMTEKFGLDERLGKHVRETGD